MGPLRIVVCDLKFDSTAVQLRAECRTEDGSWYWKLRLIPAETTIAEGASDTKIAAQVCAQLALERRLSKAGLSKTWNPKYRWKEAIEPC